jgi:hypothetical protein
MNNLTLCTHFKYKIKSFGKFEFIVEKGSHSEIEILRCDKLLPLKGISSQDLGKLGLGIELER